MWMRVMIAASGVVLFFILYTSPKKVITDDLQPNGVETLNSSSHLQSQKEIQRLRSLLTNDLSQQKNAIFADSLSTLYAQIMRFDSAAWYAEAAATFFQTPEAFRKTGYYYYNALTHTPNKENQSSWAQKARTWLEKAIEKKPSDVDSKITIALTYMSSLPMKGVHQLKELLNQFPRNEKIMMNLGLLSLTSGQPDKAVNWFEQIVKYYPDNDYAQLNLGLAWIANKQIEKGIQQLETIKDLSSNLSIKNRAEEELNKIKETKNK